MLFPVLPELVKPAKWPVRPGEAGGNTGDLWRGLALSFPFWDVAEKGLSDVSGNNQHGAFQAGVTPSNWTGSPYGAALTFSGGSTSYVLVTDPATDTLDGTSQLCVEVLFKPASVTGNQGLVNKYIVAAGQRGWRLYLTGAEIALQCSSDGANNEIQVTTAASLSIGTWYHFVLTYNAGVFKTYLNGASVANDGDFGTTTSIFAATADLRVASRSDAANFNGDLALVNVWTGRVLNAKDVERRWTHLWELWQPPELESLEMIWPASMAGGWIEAGVVPKGVQSFRIPGLTNGISYDVQIQTRDTSGNLSSGSSILSATPVAPIARAPSTKERTPFTFWKPRRHRRG